MTDLERAIARALRLSDKAAELLLEDMRRNIETARAELLRSGVALEVVSESGPLVESAIITYCQMNMSSEDLYDRYFASFQYQLDNLRKS